MEFSDENSDISDFESDDEFIDKRSETEINNSNPSNRVPLIDDVLDDAVVDLLESESENDLVSNLPDHIAELLFFQHFVGAHVNFQDVHTLPITTVQECLTEFHDYVDDIMNKPDDLLDNLLSLFNPNMHEIDVLLPPSVQIQFVTGHILRGLTNLLNVATTQGIINTATEVNQRNLAIFNRTLRLIKIAGQFVATHISLGGLAKAELNVHTSNDINIHELTVPDLDDVPPIKRLILYLLNFTATRGYRRMGQNVYSQVQVGLFCDVDGNFMYLDEAKWDNREIARKLQVQHIFSTHAYKLECTLDELGFRVFDKSINFDLWKDFHGSGALSKYLESCNDSEFQRLITKRDTRAFWNGVLIFSGGARHAEFFSFLRGAHIPPVVACRYYSAEFNRKFMEFKHFWNIPSPAYDCILEFQEFPLRVQSIFMCLKGRLCYRLGDLDNWQVIMAVIGVPSCGKSTLGKWCLNMYLREEIASLSSNIEEQFGLEGVYFGPNNASMKLFICWEMMKSWKISRAELQSMIANETVVIARKTKVAVSVLWDIPGILFGNELAAPDKHGAMSRRFVVTDMQKKVTEINTDLEADLCKEYPQTQYKFQQGYIALIRESEGRGLWDRVLPNYFVDQRQQMENSANPIRAFLLSYDDYGIRLFNLDSTDERKAILYTQLSSYLRTYLVKLHMPAPVVTKHVNELDKILVQEGYTILSNAAAMHGEQRVVGRVVVGIEYNRASCFQDSDPTGTHVPSRFSDIPAIPNLNNHGFEKLSRDQQLDSLATERHQHHLREAQELKSRRKEEDVHYLSHIPDDNNVDVCVRELCEGIRYQRIHSSIGDWNRVTATVPKTRRNNVTIRNSLHPHLQLVDHKTLNNVTH